MPPDSLQLVLRYILDDVPFVLLDDAGRQALLDCAGTLPHVLSRGSLGLELRLHGPATGALIVASDPTAPDGAQLDRCMVFGAPHTLPDWRAPDSWLGRSCACLGLEFDASRAGVTEPASPASIYLVPRAARDENETWAAAHNAFHADPFGLLSALAAITGASVEHTTCYEFRAVLEALPDRAELCAAGAMLSRESRRAPRVSFRRFATRDVKRFLKAVGRKDAARRLAPIAKALGPLSTNLCIALDLGPNKTDDVGLEVHVGSDWSAGQAGGWDALLAALVDRNLADADRAAAALDLIAADGDKAPTGGLSHVTITAAGGTLRPTKIYVGYAPAPSSRSMTS